MRFHLIFLAILAVSTNTYAGSQNTEIPEGESYWQERFPCDKQCRKEGFRGGGITVQVVRRNARICGYAEDQQMRPPYRVPGVWFFGSADSNGFKVRFLDSFSSAQDKPGEGFLWLEDNRLHWKTIKEPSGSNYAYLEDMELKRAKKIGSLPTDLLECANGADLLKQVYGD